MKRCFGVGARRHLGNSAEAQAPAALLRARGRRTGYSTRLITLYTNQVALKVELVQCGTGGRQRGKCEEERGTAVPRTAAAALPRLPMSDVHVNKRRYIYMTVSESTWSPLSRATSAASRGLGVARPSTAYCSGVMFARRQKKIKMCLGQKTDVGDGWTRGAEK